MLSRKNPRIEAIDARHPRRHRPVRAPQQRQGVQPVARSRPDPARGGAGGRDRQLPRVLPERLHVPPAPRPGRGRRGGRARPRRTDGPRPDRHRARVRHGGHGRPGRERHRRPALQLLCGRRPRGLPHQPSQAAHVHHPVLHARRRVQRHRRARGQGRVPDLLRQQPARERADHDAAGGRGHHDAARDRLPPLGDARPGNGRARALGEPPPRPGPAPAWNSRGPRAAAG